MKTFYRATLGVAAATLTATTAMAGTTDKAAMKADADTIRTETQTVRTIDAEGQVSEIVIYDAEKSDQNVAVLGTFSQQATDAFVVRGSDGELYINHIIPVEELPDPTLEVDVIDTYEVSYQGMTFTNKIVGE